MTTRYDGDRCPVCGSDETLPYAIILGAAETYGYQCLACSVTWPVIQPDPNPPLVPPVTAPDPAAV